MGCESMQNPSRLASRESRRIRQDTFSPVPHADGSSLNVHMHRGKPQGLLVIFVHGMWGRGYGSWGEFPSLVFDDPDLHADVAVFDYRSAAGHGSGIIKRRYPPQAAVQLVQEIEESGYDDVVLIGHSLGGAISLLATQLLDERSRMNEASLVVRAAFLLATPTATVRPGRARSLMRALLGRSSGRSGSDTGVIGYVMTNFDLALNDSRGDDDRARRRLPVFEATPLSDFWIAQLGISLGVPDSQATRYWASHTSLVKPRDASSPVFQWVRQILVELASAN
jgi:pimeloyl-ACP methyl ester carboxylesterase